MKCYLEKQAVGIFGLWACLVHLFSNYGVHQNEQLGTNKDVQTPDCDPMGLGWGWGSHGYSDVPKFENLCFFSLRHSALKSYISYQNYDKRFIKGRFRPKNQN